VTVLIRSIRITVNARGEFWIYCVARLCLSDIVLLLASNYSMMVFHNRLR
jgi:hypothetical protein